MKVYIPTLITSAEQAESLPIGTVAVDASSQSDVSIRVQGGWHCTGYCLDFGGAEVLKHSDMVGDQALVPIEAEEEGTREIYGSNGTWHMTPPVDAYQSPHTRYVTPWRDAT